MRVGRELRGGEQAFVRSRQRGTWSQAKGSGCGKALSEGVRGEAGRGRPRRSRPFSPSQPRLCSPHGEDRAPRCCLFAQDAAENCHVLLSPGGRTSLGWEPSMLGSGPGCPPGAQATHKGCSVGKLPRTELNRRKPAPANLPRGRATPTQAFLRIL